MLISKIIKYYFVHISRNSKILNGISTDIFGNTMRFLSYVCNKILIWSQIYYNHTSTNACVNLCRDSQFLRESRTYDYVLCFKCTYLILIILRNKKL